MFLRIARSVPVTRVTILLPGLGAAALAAIVSRILGEATPLPPVFYALVLGMAIGSLALHERLGPGAAFASRQVLRFGVALLGAAITFGDITRLGWAMGLVTVGALAVTLVLGARLSRALGDSRAGATVSAAAVAICGASAALAVAAAMPKGSVRDVDVARTVAGITVAGTVAMLLFPLAGHLFGLSPAGLGAFLGGSIHEVAQALAAGFSVSEEVGKAATVVKMLRVACIGAVVFAVGLVFSRRELFEGKKPPLLPAFLIAFVLLAALSSTGVIPPPVRAMAVDVSRWCLLMAIAALGTRTSFTTLLAAGSGPLLAISLNSLLLTALMLGGVLLVGI